MKKILLSLLVLFVNPLATQAMSDVGGYEWEESVNYLLSNKIVQGYPDATYKPEKKVNRAELVKIIVGSLFDPEELEYVDKACFKDVDKNAWFAPYVCAAKEDGIISGYPDGTFKPTQNVNQVEALKILYESFYDDIEGADYGEWYQTYLDEAEYDGMFYFSAESPATHLLTRGEMAYFTAYLLDEDGELSDQIDGEDFSDDYAFEEDDFGWETQTAEDCWEDEYFDAETQQCYFDEEEYAYDDEEDLYEDFEPSVHDEAEDFDEDALAASVTYSIAGDTISLSKDEAGEDELLNDAAKHNLIWNQFTKLIPASYRGSFDTFIVFNDAEDSTAAYVQNNDEALTKWTIAVNMADTFDEDGTVYDPKEFNLTLIHEFAHVMTLNAKQVEADKDEQSCRPQFHTGEGCAKPNAFINLFFKKFWSARDYSRVTESESGAEALYAEKPNSFITDYAATNPGEDIAETFAYFVVKTKPQDDTIKDKKILFFYQHPSLVTLRQNIRKALQS